MEVAVFGFLDRNEGMLAILAYSFMCFYTFYVVDSYEDVKTVLYGLIGSTIIVCLIGVFQYAGFDLFKSDFGKKLILPSENQELAKTLEFKYANYVIYSTLFHYNYVGGFTALVLPIVLVSSISKIRLSIGRIVKQIPMGFMWMNLTKESLWNVFYLLLSLLVGIVWLQCGARSGMIGVIVSFFVFFLLFWRVLYRNPRISTLTASVVFVLLAIFSGLAKDVLIIRLNNTLSEFRAAAEEKENLDLKDIKIWDGEIQLITKENPLKVRIDNAYNLEFFDLLENKLAYHWDKNEGDIIKMDTAEYGQYRIQVLPYNDYKVLAIKKDNIRLYVSMEKSRFTMINPNGQKIQLGPVEIFGFNNMEKLGSMRGYIWSRTLPLLKNTILLGYGPDNFVFYFPQNDLIGKFYAYGNMWMCVDKAHNFYLQQAVNNGVVALLSLLVLFISYLKQGWKLYYDCNTKDSLNILGLGIYLGVCSFLSSWLFNDSALSISPVFWIVLGLGIALNRIISGKRNLEMQQV